MTDDELLQAYDQVGAHHHSPFQMDHFITERAGPTAYGCLKQALREWASRREELRNLYREQSKARDELARLERRIAHTSRELRQFRLQCEQLQGSVGDLTPERAHELETELWVERVRERVAIDYIGTGRPSRETIEMIRALPPEPRRQLVQQLMPSKIEHFARDYLLALGNAE